MSLRRSSGRIALFTTALALVAGAVVAPAVAVVDPSVPPDAKTILEGDLTDYQYMLGAVNAPQAWTASTGAGTTIAVIDTGVDATHPDLVGRVVPGGIIVVNDDGTTQIVPATLKQTSNDWYGHGTHVAGIAAGDADGNGITGIAPDASVMPVRLLTKKSQWLGPVEFLQAVSQAIDFAAANGADVMNLSLGMVSSHLSDTPDNDAYKAALAQLCDSVAAATASGSVVVASAGNSGGWYIGYINEQAAPASCPAAISVAAVGADLERATFSSYDPTVSLSAPGLQVLSADSTVADYSKADHIEMSGTSMSGPVVAGVAALLAADDPTATPADIEAAMTSTAQDLGPAGRDALYGYGLVDAAAALGVSTPPSAASDWFTTWLVPTGSMGMEAGTGSTEAVVSWTVPAVHSVTGYTVKVFGPAGTTTYPADALDVRLQLPLQLGEWVQVVAHTTSGDVAAFPVEWGGDGGWYPPKPVRNPNAKRLRDTVVATWDPPKDTTGISAVLIIARERPWGPDTVKRIAWDGVSPFPTSGRVELKPRARWSSLNVYVVSVRPVDDGSGEEWGNPRRVPYPLPAWYGMHVDQLTGAGPRAVEVAGGIDRVQGADVCRVRTCAGHQVIVRVRYGQRIIEATARLTAEGAFHAMVWRPAGQDRIQLRILGPGDLTSGPFKGYRVGRTGGGVKG